MKIANLPPRERVDTLLVFFYQRRKSIFVACQELINQLGIFVFHQSLGRRPHALAWGGMPAPIFFLDIAIKMWCNYSITLETGKTSIVSRLYVGFLPLASDKCVIRETP